ncbi:polysaccharide biosynthesis C-terminal domain-containing protein [Gemella sp. GH3]|uniref:MATE family efflux transporter n=1 Tax=unclassified Gemella TaxID=2624949 RepID=UPI0015CFBABD|nr:MULTISPECIES: MATE family efflux transporter [unclassified Gemella]MBF0714009.1 polysaccharide biosynthesis C-terminal domain-containing protein [Gemella sp. GH3.1]NYS50961.1 polysaccharide biosynthesis C-terminal domain-containing protein [Gemella sp. GH3]
MKDMTKGPILSQILSFAIFIFIGGMLQNLYLIVDSIILGQYVGENAIAAVGIASPINFVVIGFLIGVTQGFSINMAKSFGENNLAKFRQYLYNSIILCIIIGIIFTVVLSWTNGYILQIINTPAHLFDMTHNFLFILYLGCIANLFYNLFAGVLRSIGNSFAPLIFLAISVISNVTIAYIFVAIFNLGIIGTGWATVISQIIAATSCYFYIRKKYPELTINKNENNLEKSFIEKLIKQGIPMGMQFSFTGIGIIIVQTFLNDFSTNHIAGFSVASRIQNIIIYVFVALGSGLSTFISQNYGALKFNRIDKAVKMSTILTIFLSIFTIAFVYFLGTPIAKLFTKEENLDFIGASQTYFNSVMWAYPILGLLIVYRNALQGYGFPISAMFAGIVELVMRVLVVIIFTGSYGFLAICFSDSITWTVTGIVLIFAYYYLAKHKRKI